MTQIDDLIQKYAALKIRIENQGKRIKRLISMNQYLKVQIHKSKR